MKCVNFDSVKTADTKVLDGDAKPFIEQKGVILCRSGIQLYTHNELKDMMTEDNKPPKEKKIYKEYRPASVVVKAKEKFISLPVTKEHPSCWVTSSNFKELAGGVTGNDIDVVALEGDAEGEIGLKSSITFFTNDLFEYYQDNKEVSVGYTCSKKWVENPEDVGYDIILTEIEEVNHLAITRKGRGGASVAVIDSSIWRLRPMRTGIIAWLKSLNKKNGQKDSQELSFSSIVFDSLEKASGKEEDVQPVLDSLTELKDCEQKELLVNAVKDCFDNKELSLQHKEELSKQFDSMYVSISGDSINEIVNSIKSLGNSTATVSDTGTANDTRGEVEEDSASKAQKDEDKKKEDKNKEENAQKDSGINLDSFKNELLKEVGELVTGKVKELLNINDKQKEVNGASFDTGTAQNPVIERDYSSFLDRG